MKKKYTFTLDKEVVDKITEKIKNYGGKLSPLINKLLIDYLKR